MNMGFLEGYVSEDELKIGFGVWGGMYSSDLVAKFIYKTFVKGETSKLKSLLIDVVVKFGLGALYYYLGKNSPFFRYMAIGSLVSVINSITNYFLPTPTEVISKAQSFANGGLVVQAF